MLKENGLWVGDREKRMLMTVLEKGLGKRGVGRLQQGRELWVATSGELPLSHQGKKGIRE